MITINHLKKQFGDTVACDIEQFTINDGDILGLVGNNGAGKTTLFRLLLDLLKADEGSVAINAINPAESEEWKQQVGAYIDEGFLIDFLTPEEYFSFLGKISGMTQQQVDERLKDFEQFAAGEVFGQKKLIRNLSAGNKQKVGIISALFRRPQTVILDEPFNFLDPSSQLTLKHVLTDYAHETGATLLISSHNLQHTVDISTRIALLEHGVVIRDLPNSEGSAAKELDTYFGG
ncbi:MAG: ABC transporter ATP-binding protein [Prevotella sp.]|jgi:ABC-2 type transport system ATP-binding protein|nr:ABC transporter ATP-binding protein [Prevotella sp.]